MQYSSTKNTSVKVLAGSTPIQDTSTVLSGKNMRQFVKELEAEADFVIIDTPPSGLLSDAAIVAQYVDGAVFVIRQDYTDVDRILKVWKSFQDQELKLQDAS